jgi:nucleotide-binding universal stress UspA family protein
MRVPRRLLAVLLFAVVGLLALAFSGLLDWITSVLFLVLEFLAEFLRPLLGRRRKPRRSDRVHARTRYRLPAGASGHGGERHRRLAPRKVPPGRPRARPAEDAPPAPAPASPEVRVLLPLDADRPELIAFALEECLGRRGELVLLFLRPLAVMPMGPNPLPGLAEDAQARTLLARVGEQAREAGVPLRTLYEVTRDQPATILDVARTSEADVLIMEATRRNFLWRILMRDAVHTILMHLPRHVNVLIHAP